MIQLKYSQFENKFFVACHPMHKDIPKSAGFAWNHDLKHWETKDVLTAAKLIQHATLETAEIIKKKKEEIEKRIESSKKASSNINLLCPQGLEYLPFQKAGIEFCMNRNNVLLADEMGLGKTIQAIGTINNVPSIKKVLVLATASLKYNWQNELKKWLTKPLSIKIVDTPADYNNEDILICSYNRLANLLATFEHTFFDLIIADEAHLTKNKKTGRGKATSDICKKTLRNIHMTGTPIVNRPAELYTIISRLGFEMDWYTFMRRYADLHRNHFGFMEYKGAKNLDELQTKLRASIMIRRMKSDVLTELPDKIRQPIIFEANTKELREAIKGEQKFLKLFDDANYSTKIQNLNFEELGDIGEFTLARKNTAVAKIPLIVDFVKETLENTDKVVVFAHHKDVIAALKNEFGAEAVKLSGEDNPEDRQKAIEDFQKDKNIKVFIGSILACGAGITLTASSTVIFAELDWVPGNVSQAEDRCHRIGQKNTVMVYHLIVDGSIDVKLSKMLIDKQSKIDKALNIEKGA